MTFFNQSYTKDSISEYLLIIQQPVALQIAAYILCRRKASSLSYLSCILSP